MKHKYKIGFLTTHPIQYQVPLFQKLNETLAIDLTVYFCMIPDTIQQGVGFGIPFDWDIPLLDGYKYKLLKNKSKKALHSNFFGCDTPDLYNIIKNGQFDAFIVNGWVVKSCMQLLFACQYYNVPCIVRGDSNSLQIRPFWKRCLHILLLKQYSAFLSVGKSNRKFYIQNGIKPENIFDSPHCIDNDRFSAESNKLKTDRYIVRTKWGIVANAVVFLFCGKLISKKRPMDLLLSFESAFINIKPNEKIHLLMVGDGELKSACERYAIKNNLPVTFTGFLNQTKIISAYIASDCLVLPSDYGETWGLVVNEAMACRIPAIVSNRVGCHPDLIIPGKTGEVFPFGDIKLLSNLLVSFIKNPEALKFMGFEAQKHIKQYSYDEVVKGTLEALDYVCKN